MREYIMYIILFVGLLSTVHVPIGSKPVGPFEEFECSNRFETKRVILDAGGKIVVKNNRGLPQRREWSAWSGLVDERHHYTISGTVVHFLDKRGPMKAEVEIDPVTGTYRERLGRDVLAGQCKTLVE